MRRIYATLGTFHNRNSNASLRGTRLRQHILTSGTLSRLAHPRADTGADACRASLLRSTVSRRRGS